MVTPIVAAPSFVLGLLARRKPSPRSAPPPPRPGKRSTAYAEAALRREVANVATESEGERNHTLNRAAFNLGQLVASGMLPSLATVTALMNAAERSGLPREEACRTIRSGMTAGSCHSRKPPAHS